MTSTEIAREVVAQLVAAGVRDAVLSPGSRSAPLAYAVADAAASGWLRAHVRVDERTAGFFALGLAKAWALRGEPRPVAVITTSGTAVANLHPAVLEASHGGWPLVVVSADRPHEWRDTGANQTTRQPGLFGDAVRAEFDLPARANPASVRGHVARLVAAALGTLTRDPGGVHLNVGFAEPLVPGAPWTPGPPPAPVAIEPSAPPSAVTLPPGRRTLAVAGDGSGSDAARLAEAAGWPLLAEPSSGARLPGAIVHYLSHLAAGLADDVERVVVFGHPTLSRGVSALLGRRDVEIVLVSPTARWTDVAGAASRVVGAVRGAAPAASDLAWLDRWRTADAAASGSFTPSAMQRCALALWDTDEVLLLGSSATVRAFDAAVPGARRGVRVLANRGLAGIDGLISTGHGLAAGLGEPVRVVLGDLAYQHDVGGLARGDAEPDADLQVVVLDDHGGGIFASLEHGSAEPAVFERYFLTPQGFDVAASAAAFGADAHRTDPDGLPDLLASKVAGRSVIAVTLPPAGRPAG